MSNDNTQSVNVKLTDEQFKKNVEDLKKIVETIKSLSNNDRK